MSGTRRRGRAAESADEAEQAGAAGIAINAPIDNALQSPPPENNAGQQPRRQPVIANPAPDANMQRLLDLQGNTIRLLEQNQNQTLDAMRQNNIALIGAIQTLGQAMRARPMAPAPAAQVPAANNHRDANQHQAANAMRTHHLKTSDIKIPTFTGAKDSKTPYDYLLELEKYQAILGYTDNDILHNVIPLSLVGEAYQWFRYEPPFQTMNEFKVRVRTEFQALGYKADLKRELDNRYQGTNEPLSSFIRIILDYYERIGDEVSEHAKVQQIKRLMHPEYRKALIGMQVDTLADLKRSAAEAQEMIKSYRSYKPPPVSGSLEPSLAWQPISFTDKPMHNMSLNESHNSPKLHMAAVDPYSFYHSTPKKEVRFDNKPMPKSPPRSRTPSPVRNGRCFKCNQIGHYANQCPNRQLAGQSSDGNPAKLLCNDSREELTAISLFNKYQRPFINVEILGETFPAFLDTGSSLSVIGDEVIKTIQQKGIQTKDKEKTIRFLKGDYVAEKVVTLTVDYERGSRRHTFCLVPGTIKHVLLGRDFLGPALINVHIGEGSWSVGKSPDEKIPFLSASLTLLADEACDLNVDSNLILEHYECPAEVLANWNHIDESKNEHDGLDEISLFPGTNYECLKVPSTLSDDQITRLREMIKEFLPMFTKAPGLCTEYEHSIDTGSHKPVSTTLRSMSPGKKKIFDEVFHELLKYNIIEPSTSAWSANAFVVPKADGGLRPVIDYKPINKITTPDVYPIPRLDDMLGLLGPCTYFTCLDLSKGYFQIAMKEDDKHKTSFICHFGLWQYKRMPMGLRNAPATFMRCVDKILSSVKGRHAAVYFDDVCTFSKTFDDHLSHLHEVLTLLRSAGFTVNPNKVQLCRNRFKYLGFIVEPGKCFPNPDKVACLKSYPTPKSTKEIQKFLGFVGFYRRFIPEFATHAKPLTDLLRKGKKFAWSESANVGFNALKDSLSEYTMLYLPNMDHEFIVQSDASNFSIGSLLTQEIDGVRHPVWFASRTLRPAEVNYSTTQKEILAALWAIEKFRGFIEYSHFTLETDHQAISWLNKIKDPTGRLARWFMKLQMYDFTVSYRKGNSKVMRGVDALSRIPHVLFNATDTIFLSRKEFIDEQRKDSYLKIIVSILSGDKTGEHEEPHHVKHDLANSMLTDDGMLMRYVGSRGKPWEDESLYWRVWIPASLKSRMIRLFHDGQLAGHLGIRKTFSRIEQRAYWKNLRRDVQQYVNHCITCQKSKAARLPPVPASTFIADEPWSFLTIDLMGPYARSSNRTTHLFLVVDHFTRYVEVFPLQNTKAENIIKKLWEVCLRWGVPKCILSDNGTQFTSKLYESWCNSLGIRRFFISAYHPQANLTERYCQTVKHMIICLTEKCKQWDKFLPELCFALHTCVNDTTSFTPAYANFGRELRTPFDNHIQINLSKFASVREIGQRLQTVHGILKDEMCASQEKHLKYYNLKTKAREYKVGDLVWTRTHFLSDASRGITASLLKKREGPYKVTEKVSKHVYNLKHAETGATINKVHINEISPFFPPCSENGEERGNATTPVSQECEEIPSAEESKFLGNAYVPSRHVPPANVRKVAGLPNCPFGSIPI